ncbi:SRPBCC family protein [Kutzneria albida]|uniref:Cyclase/dehydrase n=1 Tax=Kutzneria albida DSM 43870 TaxID=1449976 RepID=W5W3E4_9PSEU|nr:SRPBCC family protein [Kutzneria albida]AHH95011.1 hypothetical protein KALB_1639 [Kutzneria albida DSM 43870]
MTELKYEQGPSTEAEILVAAEPAAVWPLVCDINLPARFSTEFQGGDWLDGAAEPAAGCRFTGRNEHEAIGRWETVSTIVDFQRERLFAWVVGDPANPSAQWRFELSAGEGGTVLRQSVRLGPGPSGLTPAIRSMPEKEDRIIRRRLAELNRNMASTIEGIKALAEERG